jgi:predicted transcriptional regulator
MTELLSPNDILFAHKALNIVPGLSANARRVAGAIIDHFNRRTGQCNPSVERLAAMLEIDRATVLRATADLDRAGLIGKVSHGGKSHCASYTPQWERFSEIVAQWHAKMIDGPANSNVAKLRPSQSQNCDVERRKTATQTYRRNQSKEPETAETLQKPPEIQSARPSKRVWKKRHDIPGQRSFLLPIAGGRVSHGEAARAAADRRLFADLQGLGTAALGQCLDAMTPQISEAAAQAEIDRRGAGIEHVVAAIGMERLRPKNVRR